MSEEHLPDDLVTCFRSSQPSVCVCTARFRCSHGLERLFRVRKELIRYILQEMRYLGEEKIYIFMMITRSLQPPPDPSEGSRSEF